MTDQIPTSIESLLASCHQINRRLLEPSAEVNPSGIATSTSTEELILSEPPELQDRLREEYFGMGPLLPLISSPEITEILIRGPHQIWIETEGEFQLFSDHFLSEQTFHNFLMRLYAECGPHPDLNRPFADGAWRGFRIHVVTPPIAKEVQVNLRRQGGDLWTLDKLEKVGWAQPSSVRTLRQWIHDRRNFLVVGPTGSGKTSVLNACLKEIGTSERVVSLEDTRELAVNFGPSCQLVTRQDHQGILHEYALSDLLKQCLRMRPHRIIVGEVRGNEARDLLLALATGHRGSLGTLHATDPRQALIRLEMLIQLGASSWSTKAIQQLILLSLDGLVVVEEKDRKRKLNGIYRITSLESCGFLLEQVA